MQDYQKMMRDTFDEVEQIGAGGGGVIFKAHHRRLDKDVVLKKIHTSQLHNISHRAELDILKNLKHNYIPQMLDFIEYGDEVFTVMEYIPGKSFAQLLEEKRKFSQKDVIKWARQLCEVVDYLHSQTPPIIHCDIKPANVMLTPAGNICLIDFNISGVKTEEGIAAIGYSSGYAPVEQFAVVAGRLEKARQQAQQRGAVTASGGNRGAKAAPSYDGGERTEITPAYDDDRTEITPVYDDDRTEITPAYDDERTEIAPACGTGGPWAGSTPPSGAAQSTRSLLRFMSDGEWAEAKRVELSVGKNLVIDERTDLYSVGATLYHILTGQKPKPFYEAQIPLRRLKENVSDGLCFVIEKAMTVAPDGRFQSSGRMLKAVRNLGTVDKRYKALSRRQIAAAALTGVLTAVSALSAFQGKSVMAQEKRAQYDAYIEGMAEARTQHNYDAVEENYGRALTLFAEEPEAYYEMAMTLYGRKQYEQCIDYLSRNVYTNSIVTIDEGYGRFYYITGSCYFELEDYNSAASYYARALELQPEALSYYRDYVIALARIGRIEEAEAALKEAEEKDLTADVLSLLEGEIALLQGDFEACERKLKSCIAETADDYVKLRAYTKLDDGYRLWREGAEQYELRIGSLSEALRALSSDYQVTLLERLAQVYIDYSDVGDTEACCESAIDLFRQMEDRGYATFTSRCNIAVLYEKMGRYQEAEEQLRKMQNVYPDNYTVYKRMAFVELEIQAEKPNGERDYQTFRESYDRAQELYRERGGAEDVEMLSLRQLYEDVVANGWLD